MVSGFQSVTRNHCLISNFVLWIRRGRSVEKRRKCNYNISVSNDKSLLLLLLYCYIYTYLYIFAQPTCFPFLDQRVLRTVKFPLNGPYIQYLTRNKHLTVKFIMSYYSPLPLDKAPGLMIQMFLMPSIESWGWYSDIYEWMNEWMSEWMNERMNE